MYKAVGIRKVPIPKTSGSYSKQLAPSTTSKFWASQNADPLEYSFPEVKVNKTKHDTSEN